MKGGFCSLCPEGQFDNAYSQCRPECPMSNCSLCFTERYEILFEKCKDDRLFRRSEDKKSCIMRECSEINPGCTQSDDDMNCIECDANNHYTVDDKMHICNCAENFTNIDG